MKTLLVATFLILSSYSIFAQASGGPVMKFENTFHDFGDVTEGDIVKYTFVYKNIGTDTLRIDQIASSCGCTVANEYKRKVAPGETSKIDMQFNSSNKSGITNKSLTILSNAKTEQPAVIINIRANVVPKK